MSRSIVIKESTSNQIETIMRVSFFAIEVFNALTHMIYIWRVHYVEHDKRISTSSQRLFLKHCYRDYVDLKFCAAWISVLRIIVLSILCFETKFDLIHSTSRFYFLHTSLHHIMSYHSRITSHSDEFFFVLNDDVNVYTQRVVNRQQSQIDHVIFENSLESSDRINDQIAHVEIQLSIKRLLNDVIVATNNAADAKRQKKKSRSKFDFKRRAIRSTSSSSRSSISSATR